MNLFDIFDLHVSLEAWRHRGSSASSNTIDTLTVIVGTEWLSARISDNNIVKDDILHGVRGVSEENAWTTVGVVDVDIAQHDVLPGLVAGHDALSVRCLRESMVLLQALLPLCLRASRLTWRSSMSNKFMNWVYVQDFYWVMISMCIQMWWSKYNWLVSSWGTVY